MVVLAAAQQADPLVNSVSSRSWRRNIMTQSIAAFFNRRKEPRAQLETEPQPATATVPDTLLFPPTLFRERYESEATDSTAVPSVDGSNDPREKKNVENAITAVDSTEASGSQSPQTSDPEKVETYKGKRDPFAGGFEGGVHYKTMKWW
jgi:hypothetical protein